MCYCYSFCYCYCSYQYYHYHYHYHDHYHWDDMEVDEEAGRGSDPAPVRSSGEALSGSTTPPLTGWSAPHLSGPRVYYQAGWKWK